MSADLQNQWKKGMIRDLKTSEFGVCLVDGAKMNSMFPGFNVIKRRGIMLYYQLRFGGGGGGKKFIGGATRARNE